MWTARSEQLEDVVGLRVSLFKGMDRATCEQIGDGWRQDVSFRTFFSSLLAEAPYRAFRWETPAITTATLCQPFEFVLIAEPGLARRPDPLAFAEHFVDMVGEIATFPNLGGDATMIVPRPLADLSAYGHLAAFARLAPETQQHSLWQAVGNAMLQRVSRKPVWLSTAGAGVAWLHVRLDDRPKYYAYGPYRRQ